MMAEGSRCQPCCLPAWHSLCLPCPASCCHCVRRINFYAFLIYVQKQKHNSNTNKLRDVSRCASECVCVCVCVLKMHFQEKQIQVSCCNFKASRFRSCTSTRNILNDYGNSGRAITSSAGRGADGRGDGKWQSSTCGTHTHMYVCVCVCGGSAPPAALLSPIKSFTMQTHALFQQLPRLLSPPQLGSHTQLYLRVAGLFFLLPQRLLGWPTVRILDAPHIQPGHDERPQHMRSSKLIAAQPTCFSYAFPSPSPLYLGWQKIYNK